MSAEGRARRHSRAAIVLLVRALMACAPVTGWCMDEGTAPLVPDQVFAQLGVAHASRSQVVGAAWASDWRADWLGGRATLQWEASFGQWRGERQDGAEGTTGTRTWPETSKPDTVRYSSLFSVAGGAYTAITGGWLPATRK